jgi:Fe-S-cluster containining protein
VLVSGRDVWRIARALGTDPWTFLIYFQSQEWRPDTFILDRSGRQFRLALTKQPASKRRKSPPPCIFLMRTRNGHHRCGLGDLRPQVCKTFPIEDVGGVLCIPGKTGCACRTWSLADVDLREEAPLVEARQEEFMEYADIVQHWNSQIASAPDDAQFDFFAFCNYLLQTYDSIAEESALASTSEPEANALAGIEASMPPDMAAERT